jgi:hypothetical protein
VSRTPRFSSAKDETPEHTDAERRLLPPRDDAEAGYAKDPCRSAAVIAKPPNRAPELRAESEPSQKAIHQRAVASPSGDR